MPVMASPKDTSSAYATLDLGHGHGTVGYYRLEALRPLSTGAGLDRLPFSIRVLLESMLRNCDGFAVTEEDVRRLADWKAPPPPEGELPLVPARLLLPDLPRVPVLVAIAAPRADPG